MSDTIRPLPLASHGSSSGLSRVGNVTFGDGSGISLASSQMSKLSSHVENQSAKRRVVIKLTPVHETRYAFCRFYSSVIVSADAIM